MSDASLNEQLLTALFDGELSGEERELAERLLAKNPHYQELAKQWREQAEDVRALPRYKLDDGFAFRVMREALAPQLAESSGNTTFMTNWRTGFAAIATLAAMLLLTLFVFPKVANQDSVALKTDDDSELADPAIPADESNDGMGEMSLGGRRNFSKSGPGNAAMDETVHPIRDDNAKQLGPASIMAKDSGPDTPHVAGNVSEGQSQLIQSRSGRDYPPMKPGKTDGGLAGRPAPEQGGRSVQGIVEEESSDGNAAVAAIPTRSDEDQTVPGEFSIDQILVVEMKPQDRPFTALEEVFTRNSIKIVDSANQANPGNEAVYNVVSTPLQMKKAIEELSGQADIAGYQLPTKNSLMNLAQNRVNQSAGSGAGNSADQGQRAAIHAADAPESGTVAALDTEQLASAQQLQSFKLGRNDDPRYRNRDNANRQRPDEANDEIAELDRWFGLSSTEADSELTQYLLLVRSATTDAQIKPSKRRFQRPSIEQNDQ